MGAWKNTHLNLDGPVPLVSYGTPCMYHRLVTRTLKPAGLDWEDVFIGPSLNSLMNAVAAGLGVMAINRCRTGDDRIVVWEDGPLPKLPDLYSGIYVREGGEHAIYEELADEVAGILHAPKPATMQATPPACIGTPRERPRLSDKFFALGLCEARALRPACHPPFEDRHRGIHGDALERERRPSPAKISGTLNCACACSIRLPIP